jgi:ABC-type amino acid transport substrate-binding protein
MAPRTRRTLLLTVSVTVSAWIWVLAGTLLVVRWASVERPAPIREAFPYGELRIGVDASYPPFAVATASDLYGIDIDLGKALGERLGISVRFINMGYDGLYDSLRNDQVDALISALPIDSTRMGEVRYTVPYFNAGLVLVSRDAELEGMADLGGRSLAYEFGSEADRTARQWLRRIAQFATLPYETPTIALDAARLNVAEAALVDATSARLYLRDHPDWEATYHPVSDVLYAIAVRNTRGATWDAINNALYDLLGEQTVERILKAWL